MLTRKLFAIRGKKSLTEKWKLVLMEFNKKLIIFVNMMIAHTVHFEKAMRSS